MSPRSPRTRLAALGCTAAAVLAATALALGSAEAVGPAPTSAPATSVPLAGHLGLQRLLADGTPTGRAIVTFDRVPTSGQVAALRGLGLLVQPMKALPMAVVKGSLSALTATVTSGIGNDVYPDEQLQYFDTATSNAMSSSPAAAVKLRKRGLTGKGVTVGVVDSGCDATHADLADHVQHNVLIYSPEYANAGTDPMLVVPVDQGPASNSDIGGGHGTHVAGIIGADGHTGANHLGVAPDATIDCFSIGEVLFTTAVVSAYDYMLSQPNHLGIDVVNNSWGNSYRQFDPNDPVQVATKKLAAQGVAIVFAAGNSGSGDVAMSLNPFSQSPWVLSVAAGDNKRVRADFSSNGIYFDNSQPQAIGAGGHTVFTGDRIGIVHPDVTAPGVDVSSTCDTLGSVVGPCPPGQNTTASGTSMASPHIAGAAAVLLQAQPKLTPPQLFKAIKATTRTTRTSDGKATAPFWQVGYGYVNLDRAVALVTGKGWQKKISHAWYAANLRVLEADHVQVARSDFWQYAAPTGTVAGTDTHTYTAPVGRGLQAVQVSLSFPSGGAEAVSLFSYTVTVKDASGKTVGTTTTDPLAGSGAALATVDMRGRKPGTYSFEVSGDYAASDPDTVDSDSALGRTVTLTVVQVRKG